MVQRLKLLKPIRQKLSASNKQKVDNEIDFKIEKNETTLFFEEKLKEYEKRFKKQETLSNNKWLTLINELNIPPYTSQSILIYYPNTDFYEVLPSFVFIQHYILDKYYYKRKEDDIKFVSKFMLLDPKWS